MQFELCGKKLWLNINHLYYFYIIVNEGSLTKASEVLLVGPPSLSSQLKQLESNLGVELFDRRNNKLKLTPTGQTVYHYADSIFKTAGDMIDAIKIDEPAINHLRVGIPECISNISVLDICKKFLVEQTYRFQIKSGKSFDLLNELKNNNLDVLFVNSSIKKEDPTIHYKKISSSPLVICGNMKFQHLTDNFPASLYGAPFILTLPDETLRISAENYFKKHGIKIQVIGETKDVSMQKIIATGGLALLIAPLSSVDDLLRSKVLIEIGRPEELSEDLYMLTSQEKLISRTLELGQLDKK